MGAAFEAVGGRHLRGSGLVDTTDKAVVPKEMYGKPRMIILIFAVAMTACACGDNRSTVYPSSTVGDRNEGIKPEENEGRISDAGGKEAPASASAEAAKRETDRNANRTGEANGVAFEVLEDREGDLRLRLKNNSTEPIEFSPDPRMIYTRVHGINDFEPIPKNLDRWESDTSAALAPGQIGTVHWIPSQGLSYWISLLPGEYTADVYFAGASGVVLSGVGFRVDSGQSPNCEMGKAYAVIENTGFPIDFKNRRSRSSSLFWLAREIEIFFDNRSELLQNCGRKENGRETAVDSKRCKQAWEDAVTSALEVWLRILADMGVAKSDRIVFQRAIQLFSALRLLPVRGERAGAGIEAKSDELRTVMKSSDSDAEAYPELNASLETVERLLAVQKSAKKRPLPVLSLLSRQTRCDKQIAAEGFDFKIAPAGPAQRDVISQMAGTYRVPVEIGEVYEEGMKSETATDCFSIRDNGEGRMVFEMSTWFTNGHHCGFYGRIVSLGEGAFALMDDSCTIQMVEREGRYTFVDDWPIGCAYEEHCGMRGGILGESFPASAKKKGRKPCNR